jgi:CRISPR system Cascade subunit CasC
MSRFIQLHVLTQYPPSNLNRDDTGRPKTALVGDALRLRISSQSLKRAWRTSDVFGAAIGRTSTKSDTVVNWGTMAQPMFGVRTKEAGIRIYRALQALGVSEADAKDWAKVIAEKFGKLKKADANRPNRELEIEQLVHLSPEERAAIDTLVKQCAARGSAPADDELDLLCKPTQAIDVAMFGRMLAKFPAYGVEAAVQVAHAFTVNKSAVEDDYFSAVDDLNEGLDDPGDLNEGLDDAGAGHIGERGYGAGVFYLYLCIDRQLLQENLGGDAKLTRKALEGLLHAITKVSPTGMQNSFASRAYAGYLMAEKGGQQPRSLSQAFLKPVRGNENQSLMDEAVKALETRCENFDKVYGACADARKTYNVEQGRGSLTELITFVTAE